MHDQHYPDETKVSSMASTIFCIYCSHDSHDLLNHRFYEVRPSPVLIFQVTDWFKRYM